MKHNTSKNQPKASLPVWGWVLAAVVLVAIAGAAIALLQPASSTVAGLPAEISIAQAAKMREQGAFILDVREPDEWTQLHIPDATLIPLGDLPKRLNEVPQEREVVVVCRSGNRSRQGRDILLNAGYAKVTSMAGGVTQWQAQGQPIATGQ